ncbi:MAG: SDR family NAD(P)-dependent oxidoreductase [Opitutales bacterium]
MNEENRTVVIGGVGAGLGAALVRKFAQEGCRVAMLARSPDFIEQLEGEIRQAGGQAFAHVCDVTVPEEVAGVFSEIRQEAGPVDIFIHHAGNAAWGKVQEISPADFENSWKVCALGGFVCTSEAIKDMLPRKSGVILFTGATSSVRGRGDAVAFASAKFAVRGMAHALADDLGPEGIHVAHVIIDGFIDTPQVRKRYNIEDEPAVQPAAAAEAYWQLACQHSSAWTFEIDVRHHAEKLME